MQKRKIFIEIAVPTQLQKKLSYKIQQWSDLPIKWAKVDYLHITVVFVGFVDESVLPDICQQVSLASQMVESFDLDFDEIVLAPSNENPQTVALMGRANDSLRELNTVIERELGMLKHEHKQFRPHITLGKIRKEKWNELDVKPNISEKFHAVVSVDAVDVMESRGGGTPYISIEQCPLK